MLPHSSPCRGRDSPLWNQESEQSAVSTWSSYISFLTGPEISHCLSPVTWDWAWTLRICPYRVQCDREEDEWDSTDARFVFAQRQAVGGPCKVWVLFCSWYLSQGYLSLALCCWPSALKSLSLDEGGVASLFTLQSLRLGESNYFPIMTEKRTHLQVRSLTHISIVPNPEFFLQCYS